MLAFITLQLKAPENAPVCITYNYNIHYITHSYIHTLHHIKKKNVSASFKLRLIIAFLGGRNAIKYILEDIDIKLAINL